MGPCNVLKSEGFANFYAAVTSGVPATRSFGSHRKFGNTLAYKQAADQTILSNRLAENNSSPFIHLADCVHKDPTGRGGLGGLPSGVVTYYHLTLES